MEPSQPLRPLVPGLCAEKSETVTPQNTAAAWGSGSLPVYATPSMLALMEKAAAAAVQDLLPPGHSTVGTALQVKHLSPTPIGGGVRARGELTQADGRRLVFKVEAFDETGKIGEGEHERFIVENEKFLKKAQNKEKK